MLLVVSGEPVLVAVALPPAPPSRDVEVRKPATSAGLVAGPKGEFGHWWLQVKAFRTDADAQAYLAECTGRGYPGTISRTEAGEKGVFWRVRLGPYPSQERARATQRQFDGGAVTDAVVLFVGVN